MALGHAMLFYSCIFYQKALPLGLDGSDIRIILRYPDPDPYPVDP